MALSCTPPYFGPSSTLSNEFSCAAHEVPELTQVSQVIEPNKIFKFGLNEYVSAAGGGK